jgi:PAS domain S-box-containing protein
MIPSSVVVKGSYSYGLVALSVMIGMSASYVALDLGGRITMARGWLRSGWLVGGATALGVGIWSMHFTGMLAFNLPVPVVYHWPTVFLSLLAAIFASIIVLFVATRKKMGPVQTLAGSITMGAGIAGMHFIGMAAMRLSATCHYSLPIGALAVVVGVLASLVALVLTFGFREETRGTTWAKVTSAAGLGVAISAMHYTGMASASFIPSAMPPDLSHTVSISSLGITGIALGTLMVQALTMVTSSVDRRFAAQTLLQQVSDQYKKQARALIDAIPQQIWSGPADGSLDFCNQRWRSYMGLGLEELQGDGWQSVLHPDDRERVLKAWHESVTNGTPYEQEERHRGADGTYLWFLARGLPLRDAQGRILRWYGTNTDIEDRKQAEDELRRISGQLLRLQDEERRRIARDLHDSTGQDLVALATTLSQLHASIPSSARKLRKVAWQCQTLADQCIREVRTLSYLLHPPMLDEAGLEDAIRHFAGGFTARSGIEVELEISPRLGRMKPDAEMALFRVVQESLTNIQRHSGSSQAKIRIERGPGTIALEISDKGSGIPGNLRRQNGKLSFGLGVGIPSMQERVKLIGGQLDIESSTSGTLVRVTMPADD